MKEAESFKRRVLITVLVATVVASLTALAFASSDQSKRFEIALQVNLTGNMAAGAFSVAGAVSDSGSATGTYAVIDTSESTQIINAHVILTGANGTISFEERLVSGPFGALRQFASGPAVITAATGPYVGLVGKKLGVQEESDLAVGTDTQLLQGNTG